MNIKEMIKTARKSKFKSAATAADLAGISRSHWSNFEAGARIPLPDNVAAIAQVIGLTPDQALTLLRVAIKEHDSKSTNKILEDMNKSLAQSISDLDGKGKDLAKLKAILRDIAIKSPDLITDNADRKLLGL